MLIYNSFAESTWTFHERKGRKDVRYDGSCDGLDKLADAGSSKLLHEPWSGKAGLLISK